MATTAITATNPTMTEERNLNSTGSGELLPSDLPMVWITQGKTDHAAYILKIEDDGRRMVKWVASELTQWVEADAIVKTELPKRRRRRPARSNRDDYIFPTVSRGGSNNKEKASSSSPSSAAAAAAAAGPANVPAAAATAAASTRGTARQGNKKRPRKPTAERDDNAAAVATQMVQEPPPKKTTEAMQQQQHSKKSESSGSGWKKYPLGTKVYKEFPPFGWFSGTVVGHTQRWWYQVQYEDDDSEEMTEKELDKIVVRDTDDEEEEEKESGAAQQTAGENTSSEGHAAAAAAATPTSSNNSDSDHSGTSPRNKKRESILRPKVTVLPRRGSAHSTSHNSVTRSEVEELKKELSSSEESDNEELEKPIAEMAKTTQKKRSIQTLEEPRDDGNKRRRREDTEEEEEEEANKKVEPQTTEQKVAGRNPADDTAGEESQQTETKRAESFPNNSQPDTGIDTANSKSSQPKQTMISSMGSASSSVLNGVFEPSRSAENSARDGIDTTKPENLNSDRADKKPAHDDAAKAEDSQSNDADEEKIVASQPSRNESERQRSDNPIDPKVQETEPDVDMEQSTLKPHTKMSEEEAGYVERASKDEESPDQANLETKEKHDETNAAATEVEENIQGAGTGEKKESLGNQNADSVELTETTTIKEKTSENIKADSVEESDKCKGATTTMSINEQEKGKEEATATMLEGTESGKGELACDRNDQRAGSNDTKVAPTPTGKDEGGERNGTKPISNTQLQPQEDETTNKLQAPLATYDLQESCEKTEENTNEAKKELPVVTPSQVPDDNMKATADHVKNDRGPQCDSSSKENEEEYGEKEKARNVNNNQVKEMATDGEDKINTNVSTKKNIEFKQTKTISPEKSEAAKKTKENPVNNKEIENAGEGGGATGTTALTKKITEVKTDQSAVGMDTVLNNQENEKSMKAGYDTNTKSLTKDNIEFKEADSSSVVEPKNQETKENKGNKQEKEKAMDSDGVKGINELTKKIIEFKQTESSSVEKPEALQQGNAASAKSSENKSEKRGPIKPATRAKETRKEAEVDGNKPNDTREESKKTTAVEEEPPTAGPRKQGEDNTELSPPTISLEKDATRVLATRVLAKGEGQNADEKEHISKPCASTDPEPDLLKEQTLEPNTSSNKDQPVQLQALPDVARKAPLNGYPEKQTITADTVEVQPKSSSAVATKASLTDTSKKQTKPAATVKVQPKPPSAVTKTEYQKNQTTQADTVEVQPKPSPGAAPKASLSQSTKKQTTKADTAEVESKPSPVVDRNAPVTESPKEQPSKTDTVKGESTKPPALSSTSLESSPQENSPLHPDSSSATTKEASGAEPAKQSPKPTAATPRNGSAGNSTALSNPSATSPSNEQSNTPLGASTGNSASRPKPTVSKEQDTKLIATGGEKAAPSKPSVTHPSLSPDEQSAKPLEKAPVKNSLTTSKAADPATDAKPPKPLAAAPVVESAESKPSASESSGKKRAAPTPAQPIVRKSRRIALKKDKKDKDVEEGENPGKRQSNKKNIKNEKGKEKVEDKEEAGKEQGDEKTELKQGEEKKEPPKEEGSNIEQDSGPSDEESSTAASTGSESNSGRVGVDGNDMEMSENVGDNTPPEEIDVDISDEEEEEPEPVVMDRMDLAAALLSMQAIIPSDCKPAATDLGEKCEEAIDVKVTQPPVGGYKYHPPETCCAVCGQHIEALDKWPVDWERPLCYPTDKGAIDAIVDHTAKCHSDAPLWNVLEATQKLEFEKGNAEVPVTPGAFVKLALRNAVCSSYSVDEDLLDMTKLRDLFIRRLGIARGFIRWCSDSFLEGRKFVNCGGQVVTNAELRRSSLMLLAYLEEHVLEHAFQKNFHLTAQLARSMPFLQWRNAVQCIFLDPKGVENAWFMNSKDDESDDAAGS